MNKKKKKNLTPSFSLIFELGIPCAACNKMSTMVQLVTNAVAAGENPAGDQAAASFLFIFFPLNTQNARTILSTCTTPLLLILADGGTEDVVSIRHFFHYTLLSVPLQHAPLGSCVSPCSLPRPYFTCFLVAFHILLLITPHMERSQYSPVQLCFTAGNA